MRHFRTLGTRAMKPANADDWAALVFGAKDCADIEDEPRCENCNGTGTIRYWPEGVSQYQHPGWFGTCPDCQ
jgi:hypothetical protein